MDLPRVRRDVRGMPRDYRTIATACPPLAMGVFAVEAHELACLHGLSNSSRAGESARLPVSRPGATCSLNTVQCTVQTSSRRRGPEAAMAPDVQNPGGKTVRMEDTVVTNRRRPIHNRGARAPRSKSKQRLLSARCGDCHLHLPFPQGSRPLPAPSSDARVEMGRIVMEG